MDRINTNRPTGTKASLIITTALASVVLTGCTASAAPRAETSFNKAQVALEKGKADQAVVHAEAAVLAEPRNPGFRAMLGAAYLEQGRFEAAATSFNDALELGDTDPRTTLSYALAAIAIGDSANAIAALEAREARINPADFGLAIALAGKPEKGIHVLTNALRAGENNAKLRQNLAYTYALAGNWRAARVMAAEDVAADQLDARLTGWAADAKPEDVMKRVSKLLGVTPKAGRQPGHLALANFPSQPAMVAEAAAQADVPVARELDDADLVVAQAETAPKPTPVVSKIPAKPSEAEKMAFRIDGDVESESKIEKVDPTVASILRATGAKTAAAATPKAATSKAATPATGTRYVSKPVVQKLDKPASAPVVAAVAKPEPKPVTKVASSAPKTVDPTVASILRATGAKTADAAAPAAPAASAAVASSRYVSNPVVQALPKQAAPERKAPRRVASAAPKKKQAPARTTSSDKRANSHLVQLGSYSTRAEAKGGWASLQRKFPELKGHDVVITKAKVKGKIYYRVAAAGFGPRSARSLCGTVKSAGRGCFAYAASNPPKGAIDNGVRIAARGR